MPGWLANLTIGEITAGIIAANLEEVPLSDCTQLQINWMEPETGNPGMVSEPVLHLRVNKGRPITTGLHNKQLYQQGLRLTLGCHARAAVAMHILAQQHPDLRACLSSYR